MDDFDDDLPTGSPEILEQVSFWSEIRTKLSTPEDWARSPELLLLNLRLFEKLRTEIITDNPRGGGDYQFEVHRKKSVLLSLFLVDVRQMVIDLRAVKTNTALPVCPDRIEQFAKSLESVQCGSEDAQTVYDLFRILDHEIRTMEVFCRLNIRTLQPTGVLYSMADLCEMIGVEASKTVQNYLHAAGLPTCGRGQSRTFRLDREQAIEFLRQVYSFPTMPAHRDAARKSLNRLNPLN